MCVLKYTTPGISGAGVRFRGHGGHGSKLDRKILKVYLTAG